MATTSEASTSLSKPFGWASGARGRCSAMWSSFLSVSIWVRTSCNWASTLDTRPSVSLICTCWASICAWRRRVEVSSWGRTIERIFWSRSAEG
eukprot:3711824-Pyramimonas_sp.AAC.1